MSSEQARGVVPEFHVGDRIRKIRQTRGEDRQSFSELVSVPVRSLTRYELGQSEPRLIVLRAIALATGVDLEWLRTGVPSAPAPAPGGGELFAPRRGRPEGLMPVTRW